MKDKILKSIKEFIPYLIIIIVVVLIRSYLVTPIKVHGESMYKTLKGNEICILNKLGKIDRYDIVVAYHDEEKNGKIKSERLIKRVIGLPGETIALKEGYIFINGSMTKDKYGYGRTTNYGPITLGKDEYFLLGDNREVSKDSRTFGAIKGKDIKGTTNLILFPFTKFGKIDK